MPTTRDLALLKAFEAVLAEGRFLDESIGTVLDTTLHFFDAVAVELQPAGGAPAISRAGSSIVATAAEPAAERKESDAYRKSTTPAPAAFAEQIRAGGKVTFVGENAYLQTVANEITKNPDGSITSSSSSMSLGFELDNGSWRVAD